MSIAGQIMTAPPNAGVFSSNSDNRSPRISHRSHPERSAALGAQSKSRGLRGSAAEDVGGARWIPPKRIV